MTLAERVLNRRASEIEAEVDAIVRAEFGVKWFRPSPEDSLRLLTLRQWSFRHRLTVPEILRILLPIWRQSFRHRGPVREGGLGVSISTLTGKRSEEILIQKIELAFPDHENWTLARAAEQERQWALAEHRAAAKEDWEFPATAIAEYAKRMESERKRRSQFEQEQKRRHYRGNPWL